MKRFSRILLVVDLDSDNAVAIQRAIGLAISNQAALTVCTVVDSLPTEIQMAIASVHPSELCDIAVTEMNERLDEVVKTMAVDVREVEGKVLIGKVFIEVIRLVLSGNHDLVIKSAEQGSSVGESMFGSIDMHLMRKCPCPVWITKSGNLPTYRRILAAIDQDPDDASKDSLNRQILEMATSLALSEKSELHVVHAWTLAGENSFRSPRMAFTDAEVDTMVVQEGDRREQWAEQVVKQYAGVDCESVMPQLHVVKGDARWVVSSLAREIDVDLIVMGTVARTGIVGFFMGNTAETILSSIECSALTVKPPGFVSPVTLDR